MNNKIADHDTLTCSNIKNNKKKNYDRIKQNNKAIQTIH